MQKAMALLDEYENAIGLPKHNPPGTERELNDYLSWDRDVVEKLSAEQAGGVAFRLNQYTFYFQREFNREAARQNWAKTQLANVIAQELGSFDKYTKHEVKVSLICASNSYAQAINQILSNAENRVIRLTFLSTSIKNLADNMMSVQRAKAAKKYE